jgi:LPXTG-site transpeptidase (sortase) family protein
VSVGHVFLDLDKVQVGDEIEAFSGSDVYRYRVTQTFAVDRNDVSVLDPTPTATLTLITCIGNWIPLERDYDQRLIVRAMLLG